MTFDEYRQPDALGLAQLIRTGQVSRQEVLDAMVQRFDAVHPAVNAITCLPPRLGALSTLTDDLDQFIADTYGLAAFTATFNATGLPAISLPLHWSADGLPGGGATGGMVRCGHHPACPGGAAGAGRSVVQPGGTAVTQKLPYCLPF